MLRVVVDRLTDDRGLCCCCCCSLSVDAAYDLILDGIFGFSFSGSIRPPFDHIVGTLQKCETPIVSIDIPSGWHVENGTL